MVMWATTAVAQTASVKYTTLERSATTLTSVADAATLTDTRGYGTVVVQSVESGDQVLTPYCQNDGSNWVAKYPVINEADGTVASTITASGRYRLDITGCAKFKVEVTTDTSGSSVVSLLATPAAPGGSGGGVVGLAEGTSISVSNLSQDCADRATACSSGPGIMRYVQTDQSGTAAATTGQAIRAMADPIGRDLGGIKCQPANIIDGQATITDGSSTSVIAAAGASVINEVWEVDIANTSASDVTVDIRDGTGGGVLRTFPAPAHGGVSRALQVPLRSTANTALAADPSAAASAVVVSLAGCTTR